jgi:hypothetical protein
MTAQNTITAFINCPYDDNYKDFFRRIIYIYVINLMSSQDLLPIQVLKMTVWIKLWNY